MRPVAYLMARSAVNAVYIGLIIGQTARLVLKNDVSLKNDVCLKNDIGPKVSVAVLSAAASVPLIANV
eukprot:358344-Chlamydomonas_euryale.AAC.6